MRCGRRASASSSAALRGKCGPSPRSSPGRDGSKSSAGASSKPMPPCPRCDGSMLNDRGEVRCLSCSWEPPAQPVRAGSKVTPDEVARWWELRERGWTFQRIGEATGRHAVTVWDHLNGASLQGPPRQRIVTPEEVARAAGTPRAGMDLPAHRGGFRLDGAHHLLPPERAAHHLGTDKERRRLVRRGECPAPALSAASRRR